MRTIDFLGGEFTLDYSTSTGKHQTLLGGYVTILLGLVILFSSVFILSGYFNTEAPIVTSSIEYLSNYTEFDLYNEEIFSPIAITVGGALIPAQGINRYVTAQIEMEEHSFNNQTKNYEVRTVQTYQFVPCRSLSDKKVLDLTEKVNSASAELNVNALCPDFKNESSKYMAKRNLSSSIYYSPKLSIYPCSLSDQSLCASAQELSYATLSYATIEKLIVSSNFEEPLNMLTELDWFDIDLSMRKTRLMELRMNRLEDDKGILGGPKLKEEFVTQHQVKYDVKMRSKT